MKAFQMIKPKLILSLFLISLLCSCGLIYRPSKCELLGLEGSCNGPVERTPIKQFADEEDVIGLLHPTSRTVVYCYTTERVLADTCAKAYECKGYVRFREVPYKTADFDDLKTNTFPTRRWRDNERTPRW